MLVKRYGRWAKMAEQFRATSGKTDMARLKSVFADPKCGISVGTPTIDMMVFDTKNRVAHLSRGPSYGVDWKDFRFTN
jgi:hypothetical protein